MVPRATQRYRGTGALEIRLPDHVSSFYTVHNYLFSVYEVLFVSIRLLKLCN